MGLGLPMMVKNTMSALDTVRQTVAPLDTNAIGGRSGALGYAHQAARSLGRLETLACQVAGIVGQVRPHLRSV